MHGLARQQLAALSAALGFNVDRTNQVRERFDLLAGACGDQLLDQPPRWSGMTDDCTPVEWSVAFRAGEPDLRVLLEAQDEPASVRAYWEAGQRLTELAVDLGADDALLRVMAPSFEPTTQDAFAAAYHGFEFQHNGTTRTKVYLNPATAGDRWTVALDALHAVGLDGQARALVAAVGPLDLPLVAVDLEPVDRARVKLYLRSPSLVAFEAVASRCDPPCAADYRPFVRSLYGEERLARPPFVALHLAAAGDVPPVRAVLSLPVFEMGDAAPPASDRIASLLASHGLDEAVYLRCVERLGEVRPEGVPDVLGPYGLHSWVSFQREHDGTPRITVYFRLRAYAHRYGWLAADPVRTWPSPVPYPSRRSST